MTDVAGGAAAPADTSSSAPIEHVEAPPTPLSETPPAGQEKAAEEAPKPVPTAREALRAAAAKVERDEAAKVATAAADAKDPGADPERDKTTGKFAPKPGAEVRAEAGKIAEAAVADGGAKAADQKPAVPDAGAPKHAAPERFSPDAKAAWDTAPEPVKAEVSRMHRELTAGIEKHRASAEKYETVRQFDELATRNGTTLNTALTRYHNLEQMLRTNPLAGIEEVCKNIGVSLRDVARIVLEQPPDKQQSQSDARIRQLEQTIDQLKGQVGGVTQTFQRQRETQLQSHIEQWAGSRPHFEIMAPHIAAEMKAGAASLDDAEAAVYEKYPQLKALAEASRSPNKEPPKPAASSAPAPDLEAQTLKGQKSIKGAPSSGSEPAAQPRSSSIKEALKRAAQRAG